MNPADGGSGRTIATLSSREVYRNRCMRLREDEILRSNGTKGIDGVVDKVECAIVLPLDDGRAWLVEPFSHTMLDAHFAGSAPGAPPAGLFAFATWGSASAFRASLPCGPSGS